eukprot:jgi/Bigna1/72353/fgenesh1_pg.19_\
MFERRFQGGASVEIFSPSGRYPLQGWSISHKKHVKKMYEKEVKGFVFECGGSAKASMKLPGNEKESLGLVQPFVALQLQLFRLPFSFSLVLILRGRGKTKHRIILSTNFKDISVTPLHVQLPMSIVKRGVWLNLVVDLQDIMLKTFKTEFRCLDALEIRSYCKIRRIFTMRMPPMDDTEDSDMYGWTPNYSSTTFISRTHNFPIGVAHKTQIYSMEKLLLRHPREINSGRTRNSSRAASRAVSSAGPRITTSRRRNQIFSRRRPKLEVKERSPTSLLVPKSGRRAPRKGFAGLDCRDDQGNSPPREQQPPPPTLSRRQSAPTREQLSRRRSAGYKRTPTSATSNSLDKSPTTSSLGASGAPTTTTTITATTATTTATTTTTRNAQTANSAAANGFRRRRPVPIRKRRPINPDLMSSVAETADSDSKVPSIIHEGGPKEIELLPADDARKEDGSSISTPIDYAQAGGDWRGGNIERPLQSIEDESSASFALRVETDGSSPTREMSSNGPSPKDLDFNILNLELESARPCVDHGKPSSSSNPRYSEVEGESGEIEVEEALTMEDDELEELRSTRRMAVGTPKKKSHERRTDKRDGGGSYGDGSGDRDEEEGHDGAISGTKWNNRRQVQKEGGTATFNDGGADSGVDFKYDANVEEINADDDDIYHHTDSRYAPDSRPITSNTMNGLLAPLNFGNERLLTPPLDLGFEGSGTSRNMPGILDGRLSPKRQFMDSKHSSNMGSGSIVHVMQYSKTDTEVRNRKSGDGAKFDSPTIELMYDPVLECYYDPKSNQYFNFDTS